MRGMEERREIGFPDVIPRGDNYTRNAVTVRIIDGDTVVVDVDQAFYTTIRMSCRLAGINAPEMNTTEGQRSRIRLTELLPRDGEQIIIQSIHPDKYAGRFDGVVWNPRLSTVHCVNEIMLIEGFAQPYKF